MEEESTSKMPMGVCETGLLYVKLRDWSEDFCIESILKNKQKNVRIPWRVRFSFKFPPENLRSFFAVDLWGKIGFHPPFWTLVSSVQGLGI